MNPPKRIARKVLATAKNYRCLTKIIVTITWVVAVAERPTFTMLGSIVSALGAVIRNVKTGLCVCRDGHGKKRSHYERADDVFANSARRRCSSIKPGATPQVACPHSNARCRRKSSRRRYRCKGGYQLGSCPLAQ